MLVALLVAAGGIAVAVAIYGRGRAPAPVTPAEPALVRFVRGRLFVDEAIEAAVLRPYRALCGLAAAIDEKIVDGIVNGLGHATDFAGQILRLAQTGHVRGYAFIFFLGTIVILLWVLR
jgi:NADH-quinone oxidoreductase subunit L